MFIQKTEMTNEQFYRMVKLNNLLAKSAKFTKLNSSEFTYLIDGNFGPTGKSWLVRKLIENGYRAIDLSENPYRTNSYIKKHNYICIDEDNKTVLFILNKPLDRRNRK